MASLRMEEGAGGWEYPKEAVTRIKMSNVSPLVEAFKGEPGNKVNLTELIKGKKDVLFEVFPLAAPRPTCWGLWHRPLSEG